MFDATFESLWQHEYPEWFRNAKFGIWSHWGPQSVPMCGDWYARNMYVQGSPQYLYHIRHYGHPSKFGYKDICALWKAENFDPDRLMEKYVKAGARYFVSQAMHHDHFFNYPSELNRMNSMNVGPHKDIVGMWKAAAQKYNLPFGVTEHLAATPTARTREFRMTETIRPGGISTMTIMNIPTPSPTGPIPPGIPPTRNSMITGSAACSS